MRTTIARAASLRIRVQSEEQELLHLNAGIQGLSVSDYVRQRCLRFHVRKSPMEKERLRQLACIGANLNQLVRWANTYTRAVKAVEVLTTLASLEREIGAFMAYATLLPMGYCVIQMPFVTARGNWPNVVERTVKCAMLLQNIVQGMDALRGKLFLHYEIFSLLFHNLKRL